MKVVNHHLYVSSGCGKHSMWAWSLSHCTGASFSAKQRLMISAQLPKSWPTNKCDGNNMMTDPYPHPQHMKVVNHHLYVSSGCGKHSMWAWSLNHCTRASFSAKQWLRISAQLPKPWPTSVEVTAWWRIHLIFFLSGSLFWFLWNISLIMFIVTIFVLCIHSWRKSNCNKSGRMQCGH